MIPYGGGSASQRVILKKEGIPIAVLTVHSEFEDVVVTSRTLLAVISSEARNPGQKNKISQSQPLTLFETRSFEMTEVDLWRLSGEFRKRPHARRGGPHSDRNFETPHKKWSGRFF